MIQQAIRTIRTLLPPSGAVNAQQIEDAVATIIAIPQYSQLDRSALIREAQSIFNIRMDDFTIIEDADRRRPWINDRKAQVIWNFWNRYRDYLQVERNFSNTVLGQLDRLTDRTLDGLYDPTQVGAISKYGLVVGQVQSGKTSNYTGLICKAADVGFKFIIVLTGTHNSLRSQTQLRIDEGFLGFDTQHQRAFDRNNTWIGVGRIEQNSVAHSLTSSLEKGDFTAGAANSYGINFNTNEPIIAVVKKNMHVLRRLHTWLSSKTVESNGVRLIRNKSLLLIDDEADNASINTNPENDNATRINELIRNIIALFEKSGYVGYTATPFANIFVPIAEDSLFPRDFIINLPAPSNYIGPEQVFGFALTGEEDTSTGVLPIVRRVSDHQDFVSNAQRITGRLPEILPDSLRLAIKCFIITCAVRRLRGQVNVHNSMLIHISRLKAWQRHIRPMVEEAFDFYRRGIELNVSAIIEELREVFENDSEQYLSFKTTSRLIRESQLNELDPHVEVHDWSDVLIHLNEAASRIQVREINGGSADALNYFDHRNGLSVIAIGGDKLSRGLTLEGLSVSYYLRMSRMYDTLMQMGRWFGYRAGYMDLCRLFTSRLLNEWFCHISLASQELRNEFDYMSDIAGSTPEQYALRVRTHPGVLQISASNKIRRAVNVEVSWAGRLVESYEFQRQQATIHENLLAANDFLGTLPGATRESRGSSIWVGISVDLIRPFFQRIRLSENLRAADPGNLLRFIDAQVGNGELTLWNVAVMSKRDTANRTEVRTRTSVLSIGHYLRTHDERISNDNIYYLKKSHIISPKDEFIDLSAEEYRTAMDRTRELWRSRGREGEPDYPSGEIVRNTIRDPRTPLLLIYYLDPVGAGFPQNSDPFVGYAVSFPASHFNESVTYAVHEQLLPVFNQVEEPEDEPDNENDDD